MRVDADDLMEKTTADRPAEAVLGATGTVGSGVLGTLSILLRRRRLVYVLWAITIVATVVISLLLENYETESSFVPQTSSSVSSQLAGIAAQFGVSVGTGSSSDPDFYASLVESREVLGATVTTVYRFATQPGGRDTLSGDLIKLYDIHEDTRDLAIQKAIKKLDRHLSVSTDAASGIVTIEADLPWPDLSALVNRKLLDLVNQFNLDALQLQARNERRFVEGRVKDSEQALHAAEDAEQRFLEANRATANSPRLTFELDRLHRQVDLQQQVYTALATDYEQARINEVRNTPVITIIDRPEGSAKLSPPLLLMIAMGLFLGFVVGVATAFGVEFFAFQRRDNPRGVGELAQLGREAVQEVLPRRVLLRLRARSAAR